MVQGISRSLSLTSVFVGYHHEKVMDTSKPNTDSIGWLNLTTHLQLVLMVGVPTFLLVVKEMNELMTFWSELGFVFGKFPFVGWTRGWYAEDTENNLDTMKHSQQMRQDIRRTICAALEMSRLVKENRYDEYVLSRSSHSIT